MVNNIFRAEEEEGGLAASDFPRPSSPWEDRMASYEKYIAYYSQDFHINLIRSPSPSPDPYSIPSSPPSDFRDTLIPPSLSPRQLLVDLPSYHRRLNSSTIAIGGPSFGFDSTIIFVYSELEPSKIILIDSEVNSFVKFPTRMTPSLCLSLVSEYCDSIDSASNGYFEVNGGINSFLRSNATMIQSLSTDCHKSIDDVLASNGYTKVLQFPSSYNISKVVRLLLMLRFSKYSKIVSRQVFNQTSRNTSLLPISPASTSQIANLNGCNQQSSSMSMSELVAQCQFLHIVRFILEARFLKCSGIVSQRVFNQTSRNTSLLPISPASTFQIANLNGCNQQSSSTMSMSELAEQCQFLHNSQLSFMHETPMQYMPESVQEDSLFCPPQFEQLTTDTVLHMNHTFPPESTRQGEVATRGTEQIDNIPKNDSFQSPVEGETINIDEGDFRSGSQTVNASGNLLETNKRKISRSIELEDLRPFLGKTTRAEAAKSLGVSVSTVKRICREHEIPRWPYRKLNKREYYPSELKGAKTGASVQSSSPTMPFRDALPSKPLVQAPVQYFQSNAPSFNPPPRQLSTVTAAQTSPPVTIKATYDGRNTIIKFDLPSSATMDDLEGEVAKRLKLNVGSFTIKYQDEEGDWISVTCSDDLRYCIRTLRSLATIKMLVQSTNI